MSQSMKAALFGALSIFVVGSAQANEHHHNEIPATAASTQQQLISADGVIKDIDLKNKKITIEHKAIPAIGWPAMTMRFTFITQDSSISNLKPGDHVNFTFIQQNNISVLQGINVTQS